MNVERRLALACGTSCCCFRYSLCDSHYLLRCVDRIALMSSSSCGMRSCANPRPKNSPRLTKRTKYGAEYVDTFKTRMHIIRGPLISGLWALAAFRIAENLALLWTPYGAMTAVAIEMLLRSKRAPHSLKLPSVKSTNCLRPKRSFRWLRSNKFEVCLRLEGRRLRIPCKSYSNIGSKRGYAEGVH